MFDIQRLEEFYLSKPSLYSSLEEVLKKEKDEGIARKNDSCSRAILWLTRYETKLYIKFHGLL